MRQGRRLIKLLFELFVMIDIHGEGVVHWGEFTSFCVEAGMVKRRVLQCAPDTEFIYAPKPFRHYGLKYSYSSLWGAYGIILLIESASSRLHLISQSTGKILLTLCTHRKQSYSSSNPMPSDAGSLTYSNLYDVLHFSHRNTEWLVLASSDHTISFWKYGT